MKQEKDREYDCALAEILVDRNIAQQEVAQAIGMSRQTIRAIGKGLAEPSLTTALKLAQFFHIPVEEIFELRLSKK